MFNKVQTHLKKIAIALFLSILLVPPSYGVTVDDIIQSSDINREHIIDLAKIINEDTKNAIESEISLLQENKNKTIYLITVPSISQNKTEIIYKIVPPVSASRRFLESILLELKLDSLKQSNKVLILISLGDRTIEIRSASNLKYVLQDRHVQGIIDNIIIPKFEIKNFNSGILLGIEAITKRINNPYYNSLPNPINTTWQTQQRLECKKRALPSKYGGIDRNCPKEISYYGGSGIW